MKARGIGRIGVVGLLALNTLLAACTLMVPLKPTVGAPPTQTRLPLTVGIHYDPVFPEYEHLFSIGDYRYIVSVGQASINMFDQVFPLLFESTVPVKSHPPLPPGAPTVVAVIKSEIEQFRLAYPLILVGTSFDAEITYRFTLYTPEGDQIVSWTSTGKGSKSANAFYPSRPPGEATSIAMQDAATQFLITFRGIPEVQRWLRRLGIPDAKPTSLSFPVTKRS